MKAAWRDKPSLLHGLLPASTCDLRLMWAHQALLAGTQWYWLEGPWMPLTKESMTLIRWEFDHTASAACNAHQGSRLIADGGRKH